jgi:uncharacterized protein YbbC (DUF1343 family)
MIGAPWVDGETLAAFMGRQNLPGVSFRPVEFVPVKMQGARWPKYENQACNGVRLSVTDRNAFRPVATGICLVDAIRQMYPDHFEWTATIDRLYGSDKLKSKPPFDHDEIDLTHFNAIRRTYLRYN